MQIDLAPSFSVLIRPELLKILRCSDIVDWANGKAETTSPGDAPFLATKRRRIRTRTGWPRALAKLAHSISALLNSSDSDRQRCLTACDPLFATNSTIAFWHRRPQRADH